MQSDFAVVAASHFQAEGLQSAAQREGRWDECFSRRRREQAHTSRGCRPAPLITQYRSLLWHHMLLQTIGDREEP